MAGFLHNKFVYYFRRLRCSTTGMHWFSGGFKGDLIKEGSVFGRAPPFDLYPFDLINAAWKCIRFDV